MPELPEAEYMVRRLREEVSGTIVKVRILRPGMTGGQPPRLLTKLATNQKIAGFGRRAKSVLIELANQHTIRIRLGMSGHVYRVANAKKLPKHTRIAFILQDGSAIAFEDMRTFGDVTIYPNAELPEAFKDLGHEPLATTFTAKVLTEALQGTKAPIKPLLLDQGRVVGLGNIWAAEALWKARINPWTPANELTKTQINALQRGIVHVLTKAVERTFTSTKVGEDFPEADLLAVAVYGRNGQPCRTCKTPIKKLAQAGRSTFFCSNCQT